jgi:hypothetical protein
MRLIFAPFNPELYTQIEKKAAPASKRADIGYFSPDRLEACRFQERVFKQFLQIFAP